MLEIKDIHTYYGKSYVLQGVSLQVREGEIIGILGRNGVGKTTLLRSIIGLTPPRSGEIRFQGKEIHKLKPHLIPRLGMGYVPQGRRIFPRLTVMENLRTPLVRGKIEKSAFDEVFEYFPRLAERADQPGGTLSGGEQQMLAIGRALIARPRMVLLDEPTEGLMPSLVALVRESIQAMNRKKGVTILLVEQNLETALVICHRINFMERGRISWAKEVAGMRREELLEMLCI
jgi:branched-chain amino acid transport system ATP-binding protein